MLGKTNHNISVLNKFHKSSLTLWVIFPSVLFIKYFDKNIQYIIIIGVFTPITNEHLRVYYQCKLIQQIIVSDTYIQIVESQSWIMAWTK